MVFILGPALPFIRFEGFFIILVIVIIIILTNITYFLLPSELSSTEHQNSLLVTESDKNEMNRDS
jgi:hypothetical protein